MSSPVDPDALRRLAEAAARAGGAVAARFFQTGYRVRLKADRSEVSEADEAAQAAVLATLRAARPNDWLIAEEELPATALRPAVPSAPRSAAVGGPGAALAGGAAALCVGPAPAAEGADASAVGWIIDPIDGTRNFIRGLPDFSCAVAAVVDNQPVAGAIHLPANDRLFSASLGGAAPGLYCDGAPLIRAPDEEISGARSGKRVVGIPSTAAGPAAALARTWFDRHVVRNVGATTLHLVYLALGQYDAVLIGDSRLWDVAAGWVLVRASGGVMTTLDGAPLFPLDMAAYSGAALPCLAASSAELLNELRAPSR